jgi:hypothetical protein
MDLDFAYMVIAVQSAYSINGKLLWIAESFFSIGAIAKLAHE